MDNVVFCINKLYGLYLYTVVLGNLFFRKVTKNAYVCTLYISVHISNGWCILYVWDVKLQALSGMAS